MRLHCKWTPVHSSSCRQTHRPEQAPGIRTLSYVIPNIFGRPHPWKCPSLSLATRHGDKFCTPAWHGPAPSRYLGGRAWLPSVPPSLHALALKQRRPDGQSPAKGQACATQLATKHLHSAKQAHLLVDLSHHGEAPKTWNPKSIALLAAWAMHVIVTGSTPAQAQGKASTRKLQYNRLGHICTHTILLDPLQSRPYPHTHPHLQGSMAILPACMEHSPQLTPTQDLAWYKAGKQLLRSHKRTQGQFRPAAGHSVVVVHGHASAAGQVGHPARTRQIVRVLAGGGCITARACAIASSCQMSM
eukprot:1157870-Pelagomonas_calceolata.AAC.6